jgi:hypothetical protein
MPLIKSLSILVYFHANHFSVSVASYQKSKNSCLFPCQPEDWGKHPAAPSLHEATAGLVSAIHPPEDHALRDELDVERLGTVLAMREIDDIRDNRTDDDQPDLETDDSSGGIDHQLQMQPKIRPDASLDAITEATDITTPVEMLIREATYTAGADHTLDLSEIPREEEAALVAMLPSDGGHQQTISETLFDITDPEEDDDEMEEQIISQTKTEEAICGSTELSEKTLLIENNSMEGTPSEDVVQLRINKRQGQIDRKFERLSQEISFELPGINSNKEEEEDAFVRVASQLSQQEEEEAATSFDRLVMDNFAEDKSEDWKLSNEATPDMEVIPGTIFGAIEMSHQGERRIL